MHGGNLRLASDIYNVRQEEIIDFSSNINPLGMPDNIREIILNSLGLIERYPDPESKELKESISAFLGSQAPGSNAPIKNIICTNGSDELFYLIANLFSGKKTLIPVPSYSDYEAAAISGGMHCTFLAISPETGFNINTVKLENSLKNIDLVFLGNPNNPTGALTEPDRINHIIKQCEKHDVLLVIDEAFMDFVSDNYEKTFVIKAMKNKNLIVVRSLTKIFAIPGLRLGYATGHEEIIKGLSSKQQSWPVNCFAQEAGKQLIKDRDYILRSQRYVLKEKESLFNKLAKISWLDPFWPGVNFILCRINQRNITAQALNKHCMGLSKIIIRDCSNFRGLDSSYFRVAVKSREDNRKLVNCLKDFKF